jgi:hypothetical protein
MQDDVVALFACDRWAKPRFSTDHGYGWKVWGMSLFYRSGRCILGID